MHLSRGSHAKFALDSRVVNAGKEPRMRFIRKRPLEVVPTKREDIMSVKIPAVRQRANSTLAVSARSTARSNSPVRMAQKANRKAPCDYESYEDYLRNPVDEAQINRALISVWDKSNLSDFVKELAKFNVKIIATDGTTEYLRKNLNADVTMANVDLRNISDYTNFPNNLNGRLKTLHPTIQAGILAIRHYHDEVMKKIKSEYIDIVIVNLYPFEDIVRKNGSFYQCIENIDIGGPTLLRAAAKNHQFVTVVVDSADYQLVLDDMKRHNGCTSLKLRKKLASKVFAHTAAYDDVIARWFANIEAHR